MGGYYKKKYPEAQGLYDKYSNALKGLLENRMSIKLNYFWLPSVSYFKDSSLSGEYYGIYSSKVDDWMKEAKTIETGFKDFLDDLYKCISNTQEKVAYWDAKRKVRVWVHTND